MWIDKSLNLIANIDISKPLRMGVRVNLGGEPVWFDIKYISLLDFCYACGMLGVIYKWCELYDEDVAKSSLPYGSKLRANPIKNKRHGWEAKNLKRNRLGWEAEKHEVKQLL